MNTDFQKFNIIWTFEILNIKAQCFIKTGIINFHLLKVYCVSGMNQVCSIIHFWEVHQRCPWSLFCRLQIHSMGTLPSPGHPASITLAIKAPCNVWELDGTLNIILNTMPFSTIVVLPHYLGPCAGHLKWPIFLIQKSH